MVARHGLDVAFTRLSDGGYRRHGLSKRDAARRFHVVVGGRLVSGIPAFALLWQRIPNLRWMARLVRVPVLAPLAALVYDHILAPALFAMHRRRERQGRARHIA